jgi:nucleoside-diphosphate-sugar epimerase
LINLSSQFRGKTILVTGASGFIGSHMCRRLFASDVEIHGVSRAHNSNNSGNLRWWQGDLAEILTVRRIFRDVKPDFIFHLASHVKGAPNLEHVLPSFRSNLQTTVNLLTVAAEVGCRRIVLAGSLVEPKAVHNEYTPCSPYAAAKCASSAYARMFHALYQVPVFVARIFMVYGPGQQDLSKLIPYVTLSFLQGKGPKITSGRHVVDWIYVDDVVNGLLAAAQAPDVNGCTIDLGSGTLVSVREIVERLRGLIGGQVEACFGALADRPMEPIRAADTASTYATIGWKPVTSLERGLKHTVEWYRKMREYSYTTGAVDSDRD